MDALLEFALLLLLKLVELIRPILVPLCFVVGWVFLGLAVWNVVVTTREAIARARQMHQIPCADCRYFTNTHFLKCPIHPKEALSEAAINCPDYENS